MKTLIVIDMQPYFDDAIDEPTIRGVQKLIRQAMASGEAIFYVEYRGCGPTKQSLTRISYLYDRAFTVQKSADDGSASIYRKLKEEKLLDTDLLVCGVNTDACVARTVRGLSKKLPDRNIEVVTEACNSIVRSSEAWEDFQQIVSRSKNVRTLQEA